MAQKTCRFVILPQQERSSENPPPSKREFVRKGSPGAERARLGLESVQKHSAAEASVRPKGCCAAELSRYHENAPYAHTTLQTEGIMESLTKSSKVAIGIAGMLALVCVAALIFVLAREASILTENEHDKPVHEPTISDNLLPAYRPYSVSSSSVVFENDIDISRIYAMSISNYPRLGPDSFRYTQDQDVIGKSALLLEGARFTRWDGHDAFTDPQKAPASERVWFYEGELDEAASQAQSAARYAS